MIQGIGCDIVSIKRIKSVIEKWGEKFLFRIFTDSELKNAAEKKQGYYAYLAKRFAAKEALSKALRTGIGPSLKFKDCEILNDENGAPFFNFLSKNLNLNPHLSLSDEKEYAQAFVIIENIFRRNE